MLYARRNGAWRVGRLAHRIGWVASFCLAGCLGTLDDPPAAGGPTIEPSSGPAAPGRRTQPNDIDLPVEPSLSPRASRLSHGQWERTVQDLFYLSEPTGLSARFRSDAQAGGTYVFDHQADALSVDRELYGSYQRAAAELADRAVSDPSVLDRIGADAGSDEFVRDFGKRAFRRPLTSEELSEFTAIVEAAPALYPDLSANIASIRHVLEAFLMSPFFLYRVELSDLEEDGVVVLDDYEVASRLSYALWNSMPDGTLFAVADQGQLRSSPDEVRRQALRMLSDERASEVLERFHEQLLAWHDLIGQISAFEGSRNPVGLADSSREEASIFVRSTLFDSEGGLVELLTDTTGHVNDQLAEIYGVPGSAMDWLPTSLGADRPGLLSRSLFLVGYERGGDPDIIHRGLFVSTRLLCNTVPPPPPDATIDLPPAVGATNRERIESLTSAPACGGCHGALINPYGFPFEVYDAAGRYRETDGGEPLDATATLRIDGSDAVVSDAVALMDALRGSFDAHACYAKHWLEYVLARPHTDRDNGLIATLAQAGQRGGLSVRTLLAELVSSRTFLYRPSLVDEESGS